jgi:hypothetical protein
MLLNNASAPLAPLEAGLAEPIAPSGEDPEPSLVWLGVPEAGPVNADDHIDWPLSELAAMGGLCFRANGVGAGG